MDSIEDLLEYMWLRPNVTHLNVDVFVDDGQSYVRHDHELLLYARNGYGREVDEFVPFSVAQNPKVLDDAIDLKISNEEVCEIKHFIVANLGALQALADRNVSQMSFVQTIRTTVGDN